MSDYWSGFITGVLLSLVIAAIISWIYSLVRGYIAKIKAADKPQTVQHKTEKSPNQIVDEAGQARMRLYLLWLIVYVMAVAVLEFLRPGTLADVWSLVGF